MHKELLPRLQTKLFVSLKTHKNTHLWLNMCVKNGVPIGQL